MTDITELKQAVCAAIFESCGVLTLPDSGKSGKSPFFAVKASEGEGVVMDGGRIDAVGTHEELMQSNRIYQEVYHSQTRIGGAQ